MACYTCEKKVELRQNRLIKARERAKVLRALTGEAQHIIEDGFRFLVVGENEVNGREIVEYFI